MPTLISNIPNILFKKYLHQFDEDSTELELLNELLPELANSDEHIPHEIINRGAETYWTERTALKNIDNLLDQLQRLKEVGCNYVEIMYHEDHQGYVISGAKVWEPSPEELEAYKRESAQNKFDLLNHKREMLERQINLANAELEKISKELGE